ncbi:MAG: hypothetical protein ACXAC5_03925 [Promethearchaeota archaeon]|jgi:hypothetical protein
MITALTLIALSSIVPDANVELGYGRVANRVGKPSFEILRLRVGIANEDWLKTSVGVSVTIPTTLPTSVGLQAGVLDENSQLWVQVELGYAAKHFVGMAACGWWVFGAEIQVRNTDRGSDILVFGKVSFSLVSLYKFFSGKERNDEDERHTVE